MTIEPKPHPHVTRGDKTPERLADDRRRLEKAFAEMRKGKGS